MINSRIHTASASHVRGRRDFRARLASRVPDEARNTTSYKTPASAPSDRPQLLNSDYAPILPASASFHAGDFSSVQVHVSTSSPLSTQRRLMALTRPD